MTVLSMPLGVPWWIFSVSKTRSEMARESSHLSKCSSRALTMAVETAAPLPSPRAIGMVELTVMVRSCSSPTLMRSRVLTTMVRRASSGGASLNL